MLLFQPLTLFDLMTSPQTGIPEQRQIPVLVLSGLSPALPDHCWQPDAGDFPPRYLCSPFDHHQLTQRLLRGMLVLTSRAP
jgi:hypothetical protein